MTPLHISGRRSLQMSQVTALLWVHVTRMQNGSWLCTFCGAGSEKQWLMIQWFHWIAPNYSCTMLYAVYIYIYYAILIFIIYYCITKKYTSISFKFSSWFMIQILSRSHQTARQRTWSSQEVSCSFRSLWLPACSPELTGICHANDATNSSPSILINWKLCIGFQNSRFHNFHMHILKG